MATDIRELDRRAVRTSVEVVSLVTADDLGRATPCSEWTLGDLLAHMTVQHLGFASAAAGGGANPAVWRLRPLAADGVLAAFAEEGALNREVSLPEISTSQTVPAAQAIGFHLVDYVVHGWDVARSLGVSFELDPDVAEAALRIALAVPDGLDRLGPGSAFRPSQPAPAGASQLSRIVSALGRSPSWPR